MDFKPVSFGEDFHAQQIRSFASGIEVKGPFGGIGHCVLGGKKAIEYAPLILFDDSHSVVAHHQFGTPVPLPDRNLYLSFVRGIFNGIFDKPVNDLMQRIQGHADRRRRFESALDVDLSM